MVGRTNYPAPYTGVMTREPQYDGIGKHRPLSGPGEINAPRGFESHCNAVTYKNFLNSYSGTTEKLIFKLL